MAFRIYLSPPDVGVSERESLIDAFDSNWIAPFGPALTKFESQLSQEIGTHIVATNSGTAALHLLLLAYGIGEGDFVLCSNLTFAASVFAIDYVGAKAILVPSEPSTWNISPDALEATLQWCKAESIQPKAILVTHLYGMPADINAIDSICRAQNILVLEDAAEALGSQYKEVNCGAFGEGAALSFNGNKIITTSGGGAVSSNNQEIVKRVSHLANQAKEPKPYYFHTETGFNYRMSNISAAIGVGQMLHLQEKIGKKRRIFNTYKEALEPIGFTFQEEKEGAYSNRWLTAAILPKSERLTPSSLIAILAENGIESRHLWTPMHQMPLPYLITPPIDYRTDDYLFEQGICLPSGTSLTSEEQEEVIQIIKTSYQSL